LDAKKNENVWAVLILRNKEGKEFKVNLPNEQVQEVPLEGTDFKIKIDRYLPDARVVENKLTSKSKEPNNPALEFRILEIILKSLIWFFLILPI